MEKNAVCAILAITIRAVAIPVAAGTTGVYECLGQGDNGAVLVADLTELSNASMGVSEL